MTDRPGHDDDELEGGWQLIGSDGDGRPVRLVFGETQLRRAYLGLAVGRHPALCDIVLNDPTVSRRHFRIGRDGEQMLIEDLNSLNGTLLDGRSLPPFAPEPLSEGQRLEIGAVTMTLAPLTR